MTNYPTSLDALTNPAATDRVTSPSHADQHANANDAIEALETKVGVDSSAVTSTLDYKLKNAASVNPGHLHSEAGLSTSDVTTLDVSTSKHGFAPKAPNDATKFLDGTGAWDTVKDSDLATTDITTNNVSTSKHGFAPKGDGSTTKFLNANGAYTIVGGGTTFDTTQVYASAGVSSTFVDLDLSSVVGAASRVVMLRIATNGSGSANIRIRRKGEGTAVSNPATGSAGTAALSLGAAAGISYVIVVTNSSGVVEWQDTAASGAGIQANVEAYW